MTSLKDRTPEYDVVDVDTVMDFVLCVSQRKNFETAVERFALHPRLLDFI